MPKSTRKRKLEQDIGYKKDTEYEIPKIKHRSYDAVAQAEDEQLSKILFGGAKTFLKSLEEAEQEDIKSHLDSGLGEDDSDDCEMDHKPAWTDDDDDGIEVGQALKAQGRKLPHGGVNEKSNKYSDLLKHKFESINGTPKWLMLKKSFDEDDETIQCGILKNYQGKYLPSSILEHKKMKDLNTETYSEGPYINSIEFLSSSSVALVAGQSGVASFFTVDGKKNTKLHSIGFQHYPIFCAKVVENNNEAIFGSRHSYIYSYDLIASKISKISLPPGLTTLKKFIVSPDQKIVAVAGKWGEIHLLAAKSKEKVGTLKQSNDVNSLSFSPNGKLLYSHSDTGEITIFDMNMKRVKHKFVDEGCLRGTNICVSPSNQFVATGSAEGVVNVYSSNSIFESINPKPTKTLMNLTTSITSLQFNPTSEILAFASVDILNSVKLYHVNSSTVFKNFPSYGTKFGNISVINFSPSSGFVAFGNKKSTVALYRLNHFKNY